MEMNNVLNLKIQFWLPAVRRELPETFMVVLLTLCLHLCPWRWCTVYPDSNLINSTNIVVTKIYSQLHIRTQLGLYFSKCIYQLWRNYMLNDKECRLL